MSAQTLKCDVESSWSELKENSGFFRMARAGAVTGKELGRLLSSTKYLITNTPRFLNRAVEKAECLQPADPSLVEYFREGRESEVGHDQWAARDIRKLKKLDNDVHEDVVPSMQELVAFIDGLIDEDVVLLVPYILWAEYLVVVSAPEIAEVLNEKCNLPPETLSVFLRHAELDKEHTDHDQALIDDLLARKPEYTERFSQVIGQATRIYQKVWNEIVL